MQAGGWVGLHAPISWPALPPPAKCPPPPPSPAPPPCAHLVRGQLLAHRLQQLRQHGLLLLRGKRRHEVRVVVVVGGCFHAQLGGRHQLLRGREGGRGGGGAVAGDREACAAEGGAGCARAGASSPRAAPPLRAHPTHIYPQTHEPQPHTCSR